MFFKFKRHFAIKKLQFIKANVFIKLSKFLSEMHTKVVYCLLARD